MFQKTARSFNLPKKQNNLTKNAVLTSTINRELLNAVQYSLIQPYSSNFFASMIPVNQTTSGKHLLFSICSKRQNVINSVIKQRHQTVTVHGRRCRGVIYLLSRGSTLCCCINELAMGRHGLIKAVVIEWPMSASGLTLSLNLHDQLHYHSFSHSILYTVARLDDVVLRST